MQVINKYKQNAKYTSGFERRQGLCSDSEHRPGLSSPGSAPALVNSQIFQIETALGVRQDVQSLIFSLLFCKKDVLSCASSGSAQLGSLGEIRRS